MQNFVEWNGKICAPQCHQYKNRNSKFLTETYQYFSIFPFFNNQVASEFETILWVWFFQPLQQLFECYIFAFHQPGNIRIYIFIIYYILYIFIKKYFFLQKLGGSSKKNNFTLNSKLIFEKIAACFLFAFRINLLTEMPNK